MTSVLPKIMTVPLKGRTYAQGDGDYEKGGGLGLVDEELLRNLPMSASTTTSDRVIRGTDRSARLD